MPLSGIVSDGFVDELLLMLSWPVAEPAVVGSNKTAAVAVWPGLRVKGTMMGESEKPVPVTLMELTVTAAVPLEVNVRICVTGVFSRTLPNEMVVALTLSAAVPVFNCSERVREMLPVVAVSVTA